MKVTRRELEPPGDRPSEPLGVAGLEFVAQSLLDSEERFRATFEQAAVGIAHTTTEGRILQANRKLCDMLGYTAHELVAFSTRDLTHPDDRDRQDALRWELLTGKRPSFSGEKRYIRKDGALIWVNRTVTLARRPTTGEPYLIQVIEDISDRKRTDMRLGRVTRARQVMAGCNHILVHARDETSMLESMCRIVVESGGYKMAWVGLATGDAARPVRPVAHAGFGEEAPMTAPAAWDADGRYRGFMVDVVASGRPHIARDILRDPRLALRADRARKLGFQSSIALPLKGDGRVLGAIALYAAEPDAFDEDEITLLTELAGDIAFGIVSLRERAARRRAEAARQESERRFREIFEQAAVGITRVDLNGVLVDVNQKFCDMLGYAKDELLGKHIRDITHADDYGKGAQYRAQLARHTMMSAAGEKRFVRKDGSVMWTRRTMSTACDVEGRPLFVISVVEDITERKQAEAKLRRTTEMAQLLESLARAASEAATPEAAMRVSLERICEHGGWALGRLGIYGGGSGKRFPEISLWHTADTARYKPLITASDDPNYFSPSGRFISVVLNEKRPVWLGDLDASPGFGRSRVTLACGLKSAFAFPIIVGGQVAAFMEFFAAERRNPDSRLLEAVTSVGAHLGRLIERRRAEVALLASEQTFRATFDNAPVGIMHTAIEDERILQANSRLCEMLGYAPEALMRMRTSDFVHPDYIGMDRPKYREAMLAGDLDAYSSERLYRRNDGSDLWVNRTVSVARDASGRPLYFIRMIEDVTVRKRAEAALRESEEQFRQLANNIPQVFWITDVEHKKTIYLSPAAGAMTGRPLQELYANPRGLIRAVHPEDRRRVYRARRMATQGGYDETYRVIRPDGSVRWINDRAFPVRDGDGRVYRVAGIAEDVTDRKVAEARLLQLAHYDVLTSLPNRVLFYDRLHQALAQARRNQWVGAVMFIDVDRFKNVNDTLGHSVGDKLLQQISGRLMQSVRSGDTVGRLGGDEFAIILSNLSTAQDANPVAQKLMASFKEPIRLESTEIYVTASIGITLFPGDSSDPDTLIRNADTAMYRAKEVGRNSYQFYTPEMNARALEALSMENSLRRALDREEFILYYQPKVSIADGEILGVEALLRWQHPERGLISPAQFMPVLEETGLIVQVGEWVLRQVCAQIGIWAAGGIRPRPVAVNLSARQFNARDFGNTVREIIEEMNVEPGLIELEITESSLMTNTENAAQILEFLGGLGVGLSIDDFGTGYSSLSYLKRFPLDTLKIDRSFIRDITVDSDDAAITRAVISMAHSLGLKVVAEGVETIEQLELLASNGCDEIQGYLFSRPLPAGECGAWLAEDRHLQRRR